MNVILRLGIIVLILYMALLALLYFFSREADIFSRASLSQTMILALIGRLRR